MSDVYSLPTSVEVGGQVYKIRSDYRPILDIIMALNDVDLDNSAKARTAIEIFYPDYETIPYENLQEAFNKCLWFIRQGKEDSTPGPVLMDWESDANLIIPAINRVAGQEVRAVEYMHFWTFLGFFYEIGGDCTFANVVAIRDKIKRGKKLGKHEKEYYRRNKDIIDLKSKYSSAEKDLLTRLT